jgi:hypothetical protein
MHITQFEECIISKLIKTVGNLAKDLLPAHKPLMTPVAPPPPCHTTSHRRSNRRSQTSLSHRVVTRRYPPYRVTPSTPPHAPPPGHVLPPPSSLPSSWARPPWAVRFSVNATRRQTLGAKFCSCLNFNVPHLKSSGITSV